MVYLLFPFVEHRVYVKRMADRAHTNNVLKDVPVYRLVSGTFCSSSLFSWSVLAVKKKSTKHAGPRPLSWLDIIAL